jgi:hypothetical protein
MLLPLDPYVNTRHHDFLAAMERRARGGRRRRRRGGSRGDAVTCVLTLAKNGVLLWGALRCLGALVGSQGQRRGGTQLLL